MPFLLRLCIGLVVLVPTLVHAQGVLESPGDGANLSGIGFISGWKCNAGTLTVTLDDGPPIPVAAGQPRADTRAVCGTTNNGFITQMNWAFLDEGVHIAKAYDNGVVFATNIFEVATLGEEFVKGAAGECRVPDFPGPGESTLFGWNESTQHLEIIHLEIIYEGSSPADHGDTANEATQVLVPSSTSGKFEDPEDRDWFAIRVIEAGVLMVELRGEESILGHLFHHTTGLSILAVESREREVAVTPGDYLFIVERGFAGVGAEYELEVWMRGGGRAAADHGQGVLESPSDGANLSGIGFISGWKCNAGTLTITLDDGPPIPVAAGQPRADTRAVCGTTNNGFITQMNWAFLDEGVHIAKAYDNEVVFATNIFEVATLGEEFVKGAAGECRVPDFPGPGESTLFGWNESTQHLEVVREESGVTPHPSDAPENLPQVATVVGLNSSTSETLEAQGDVNYFRIEILQDGVVIVETTGRTDTVGHLRTEDGQYLDRDNDGGAGGNFRLERSLTAGTYYIRVSGQDATTTGAYTLRVRFSASKAACTDDDHGNTREAASTLDSDGRVQGTVECPGDADMFRVSVSQVGLLKIHTEGQTALRGEFMRADGSKILSPIPGNPDGINFSFNWAVIPGDYFIQVAGLIDVTTPVAEATTGPYTLVSSFVPCPADDHGDDRGSATPVGLNQPIQGEVSCFADNDYFVFTVPQRGDLVIWTEDPFLHKRHISGILDPAEWTNPSGYTIASNLELVTAVEPGTYYFGIQWTGLPPRYPTEDYTLWLLLDKEPNVCAGLVASGEGYEAIPLVLGGPYETELEYFGDHDCYSFTLQHKQAVRITTYGEMETEGELRNGYGDLVAEDNDHLGEAGNFLIVTEPLEPGTYYISVNDWITERDAARRPRRYQIIVTGEGEGGSAPDGRECAGIPGDDMVLCEMQWVTEGRRTDCYQSSRWVPQGECTQEHAASVHEQGTPQGQTFHFDTGETETVRWIIHGCLSWADYQRPGVRRPCTK